MVFSKVPRQSPKVTEPPPVTYKFGEMARVLTNELSLSRLRRCVHPGNRRNQLSRVLDQLQLLHDILHILQVSSF